MLQMSGKCHLMRKTPTLASHLFTTHERLSAILCLRAAQVATTEFFTSLQGLTSKSLHDQTCEQLRSLQPLRCLRYSCHQGHLQGHSAAGLSAAICKHTNLHCAIGNTCCTGQIARVCKVYRHTCGVVQMLPRSAGAHEGASGKAKAGEAGMITDLNALSMLQKAYPARVTWRPSSQIRSVCDCPL